MSSPSQSVAGRLLKKLAETIYRYPRAFFYPQILLLLLGAYYTLSSLQFDMDRNSLVGGDANYYLAFKAYKEEFSAEDDLVVVVESETAEKNRQFVERLGTKLTQEPETFSDVFYKANLSSMGTKGLQFLDKPDLVQLRQTLADSRPFLESFSQANNLVSLFELINTRFRTTQREDEPQTQAMVKAIPGLERIIRHATDSINRPGNPPSPGVTALFDSNQKGAAARYLTFAQDRVYLVTAKATHQENIGKTIERLRVLIDETKGEVSGVNVGLTGEDVLEYDEMRQSRKDSLRASLISLVLTALIFIYGYRETGRPLKAVACLVVGIIFTLAYTTFVIGHLNILTVTFLPILIGLAIDFGVHLITRYEEELRSGSTELHAITMALVNTGQGIFTGALTTAAAFFAMAGTKFKGIQEMGIICGGGLMVCLLPMMTLLPVLLLRGKQNLLDHRHPPRPNRREQIEKIWLQRPRLIVVITLIVCGLGVSQLPRIQFDYNLLNMQSAGLAAVEYEKKLLQSAEKSLIYGVIVAEDIPDALAKETALTQLPSVHSVDSMAKYFASRDASKLQVIDAITKEASAIRLPLADTSKVDLLELRQALFSFQGYAGLGAGTTASEDASITDQLHSLQQAILELRVAITDPSRDPLEVSKKLTLYQQAFFQEVQETFRSIQGQDASSFLQPEDLPANLRSRFVGKSGKLLLQVYPRGDIWERDEQEKFVKDLRSVDESATGTPVQLYEYTRLLRDSFLEAGIYALIAVTLMVVFHFRSVSAALLSVLPVGVGFLGLMGVMGFANIPFNPANIMTFPLVIGIGVTNGIHILNRYAEEKNPRLLSRSTGKAVMVSGFTTTAGFGSLIFGGHQGIASLGLVMSIGVAACMVASLTFLPAILTLIYKHRHATREVELS